MTLGHAVPMKRLESKGRMCGGKKINLKAVLKRADGKSVKVRKGVKRIAQKERKAAGGVTNWPWRRG